MVLCSGISAVILSAFVPPVSTTLVRDTCPLTNAALN
ncbi:unnamed protein product [Ectocarpus sp. CCAP 1310/34]|nr:unnamed protein product [Ectocarpus sp. CCAP 1310/34]